MPDLDQKRIAAAALAVVDERGADGFTMRSVATALGVTPMALYHHVAHKAALAALLIDAAVSELPLPPPTGDWQHDLLEMSRWMRATARAHPAVSQLRRKYQVWTPSVLPMTERWFNVWQQSGLELPDAVLAATTSSMAIIGIVEQELLFSTMASPASSLLTALPSTRLAFEARHDREADFELLVSAVIDGLHRRLSA